MNKKLKTKNEIEIGSAAWNNAMFLKHPTPYNGIAGWIERRRTNSIIKAVKQNLKKPDPHIVELGCEAGNLLLSLEQAFPLAQISGLDISSNALAKTREKVSDQVQLAEVDICQPIVWNNKAADFIICSETLEHIPNCELALQNIAQLAQENTILIFTVPIEQLKNSVKKILTKLGLFNLLFSGIEQEKSEWHVQDFSKETFQSLIAQQFEILQYKSLLGLHQEIIARKAKNTDS